MLLALALPLLAQSRDPVVFTQDLLAECQKVFISCARGDPATALTVVFSGSKPLTTKVGIIRFKDD